MPAETFRATVVPAGNATGAEVPAQVVDALGEGRRVTPVTVQNLESFEHLCELRLDALGEYLRSGGRTGHDQGRQRLISQRLRKKKELHFERSYRATLEVVWAASTDADQLQA